MGLTLQVEARSAVGSKAAQVLRASGKMPAIVYGPGREALPVTLSVKDFEKVWREAGESTVIGVEGLGKRIDVLVQEVTTDVIFGTPTHADLYAVDVTKTVEVAVPLEYTGVAPAEKELGGTLIKVLHEIEIEALPKDLPHEIVVDISILKTFDDQIHVRDIALPQGVTAVTDGEEVVALVQEAREEVEAEVAPTDLSAIAVEKKGKEEVAE